jgi:hypothetical protein
MAGSTVGIKIIAYDCVQGALSSLEIIYCMARRHTIVLCVGRREEKARSARSNYTKISRAGHTLDAVQSNTVDASVGDRKWA